MVAHKLLHPIDLSWGKSSASFQSDRIEPELRHFVISLNMYMRRFIPITRVKEETVGTHPQYRWHLPSHHLDLLT
jgi:hypothetical protein